METLNGRFLETLGRNSAEAGVLVLVVALAQWGLGKRIAPRWRCALWLLVMARLLLPVSAGSGVSLFNLTPHLGRRPPAVVQPELTAPVVEPAPSMRRAAPPAVVPNLSPATESPIPSGPASLPMKLPPVITPAPAPLSWPSVLFAGWLAGVLFFAGYMVLCMFRLRRRFAKVAPVTDAGLLALLRECRAALGVGGGLTLAECPALATPALYGFWRPKLLLPAGFTGRFSPQEQRFILLHEVAHVRRRDILFNWLATLLQIPHWFNPLIWYGFARWRADRELACDALALSYAREEENKPYGRTIIRLLEGFGGSAWAPSLAGTVENKNQMKERIGMIAAFKKTKQMPALAGALFIGLGLVTLTDAQTDGKQPTQAAAGAPRPNIVGTSPAVGAKDVDPGLAEITVTFDQDMSAGYSWTGGGADYPPAPEGQKAQWRDKRTCVLPVKLETGHYYRVGINSTSYHGFRSEAGVPVTPSAIYFTTQGASPNQMLQMQPPRIVATSPAVGATDVDPAVTEVTVTFDQEMGGGMSWTGGGPDLPESPEGQKAQWRDKYTCVLPVKLEAGHFYRVGINSTSYQNFANDHGVAALPSALYFTTQGASDEAKARTLVPHVASLEPSNGAQNVSPAITEVRATFDVAMGGGMSWCTMSDDGADFPKGPEGKRAYWTEDKKTCVLPVELKPGMTYRLSLNAAEFKNFQSGGGVPLEPVEYTFTTSGN
jgi:beta-lactamase regulating signal transducer with metallopeptidase domain